MTASNLVLSVTSTHQRQKGSSRRGIAAIWFATAPFDRCGRDKHLQQ
jgi:hypothetical protein